MAYVLKQFDTVVLRFTMESASAGFRAVIVELNEQAKHLVPLSMPHADSSSLTSWLKGRVAPVHRAYIQNFLAKQGLNERDTKGIILLSRGLSLTDSYWVCDEGDKATFDEVNLFDNPFSTMLASIAFTGYGSYMKSEFRSSPEFTTNGMLAKCWRRVGGQPVLYKAGSVGFANSGREPYSEYYAAQVAKKMGLNAVDYGLSRWKGLVCSTCVLFTSKDTSFIPIASMVAEGGIREVEQYYREQGDKFFDEFVDMVVFDAVICNTDRHLGNYGLLVDNTKNVVLGCAPIFDNGLSLFDQAMEDDMQHIDAYAATRIPATYPDFVAYAKELMGKRQRDALHRLVDFRFERHPRYYLPAQRMRAIEGFVARRVAELLA